MKTSPGAARTRPEPEHGRRAEPEHGKRPRQKSRLRLTERDREILAFVADHRLVLPDQVQARVGSPVKSVGRRLRALEEAGYLKRRTVFHRQPACWQVTTPGLRAVSSPLPRPRGVDPGEYLHDVGLGWAWLAAAHGALGPVAEVLSERRLRSREGFPQRSGEQARTGERFGVPLWELGPRGRERLHFPDLLLRRPDGRRIAVELELSAKGAHRLEKIMSAYAADRHVDAVVYLVEQPGIERRIRAAAERAGATSLVHVQPFAWTPAMERLAAVASHSGVRAHGSRSSDRVGASARASERVNAPDRAAAPQL